MIIKQMLGIHWTNNKDGAAYYEDENGNDWYEFRNTLDHDKPIIVVMAETRTIIMYELGDPTYIGLRNETLDVYQLDEFPVTSVNDFLSKSFTFSKDGEIKLLSPTLEDLENKRLDLRAKADYYIVPLQDAADMDEATDEELAILKKWKSYRIKLLRLDLTAPDFQWPEVPQ